MLGTTYYHETIRKYVAIFGTLFNDINIQRRNSAGVITEQIKVPIEYSAKDRMLLHIRKMSTTDASVQTTLPRMGFVLNGITYDGTRKLNTLGQVYAAPEFTGEIRCDLHPRWSPDGKCVTIDSVNNGDRQIYLADLSGII